jgi:EAL domain-containing protein (putative c-di-GMP-specific phosphodiesterase class I)
MAKKSDQSPQPTKATVDSPPIAPAGPPLCYVVDEDAATRQFLSLVLHGTGIDTVEFPSGAALREDTGSCAPALLFHDVSIESADAIASMATLGKRGFSGALQLMSGRGAAVLDHVKNIGLQHKLNMLPPLKKPFEAEAIVKITQELKLGLPPAATTRIDLDEALNKNWIEFWYQPKIDLRKKQLAGAEAYARARHPQHGIVLPTAFMPDAKEASVVKLSQLAIERALAAGAAFSRLGVNLRVAVDVPLEALIKLAVEDMVKAQHPQPDKWAGLIIDIAEEQIVGDLATVVDLAKKLESCNVRLAVDDFGRNYSALSRRGELPFAELKLDSSFIVDCGTSKINAPVCKAAIDLAHNFGRAAVALGIEKAADALALVTMGCDFGQGFLLGQPMAEERFVSLLRQRAGGQGRAPAAGVGKKQPA